MAYCVNPHCQDPDNTTVSDSLSKSSAATECKSCQTSLLINGRHTVIGTPLSDDRKPIMGSRRVYGTVNPNARVYEVHDNRDPRVTKILKVLQNSDGPLGKLFAQEQQMLLDLDHIGIPKGSEKFDFVTPYGQVLPCLIMEKIVGQNLEQRRSIHGAIDRDTALSWLKQLAEILHHIHQKDFFHRDIKPSNIMQRSSNGRLVLIDFGTVRQETETIVVGNQSTVVISLGYTAPEQLNGQAEKRSDFYALGKTILYLLMDRPNLGVDPNINLDDAPPVTQKTFVSRSSAKLSPAFERLLFSLIQQSPEKRPKNTETLLKQISRIEQESIREKRKINSLFFISGISIGTFLMIPLLKSIDWQEVQQTLLPAPTCDGNQGDFISCGEEMLIDGIDLGSGSPDVKKMGIEEYAKGDYGKALELLKLAFEKERDPETLIYINNAKVHLEPRFKDRTVTIAAIVPIGKPEARTRAISMLRGMAQAQTNALEKYDLGLQIVIADDKNSPKDANAISSKLVKRSGILGGVGHASSETMIASLPDYRKYRFVFIAPASTSEELVSSALEKNHIFFRSLPSNRINANFMAALLTNKLSQPKISIYYNPDSSYSRSLASELRDIYKINGGQVVDSRSITSELLVINKIKSSSTTLDNKNDYFRIENEKFDPNKSLAYARSQGANVHILIPDGAVNSNSSRNSIKLVRENRGQDLIITGDSLAGVPDYLKGGEDGIAQYAVGKMIFSAAWDPSADPTSSLSSFWKSDDSAKLHVDWRTHTSYNATWIMATALSKSEVRTREQLREELSSRDFSAIGIGSGNPEDRRISFQEQSGEIANPSIITSMIAKCNNKFVTVLYKNPICPDNSPASTSSELDMTK